MTENNTRTKNPFYLDEMRQLSIRQSKKYWDKKAQERRGIKTIIHVNQHVIKANRKNDARDPVLTVKTYKTNDYAHSVDILDAQGNVAARVVYSPDKPLSCGAHVWIETQNEVKIS